MNKKLLLILVLIITLGISSYQLYKYYIKTIYESMSIEFSEVDKLEYGCDTSTLDLVQSHEGEIIEFTELDTNTVGQQNLKFLLIKKKVEREFEKTITIEDTQKPIIELKKEKITIEYNKSYDPKDNVEKVYDVVDGELEYEISHKIKKDEAGDYKVTVTTTDKHQNEQNATFTVTVKEKPKPVTVIPSIEPITTEATYINGILLVNKQYGIPSSFGGTDSTALSALNQLQAAANAAGYSMPLLSGYRSYSYQENLYNSYVAKYGVALTDTFSARPGHSEHQTGLAFDVGKISDSYGETSAGIWLKENCAQYGFIIRYLRGKEYITGYKYEPWHIRYVGVDHATAIMQQGITLEEYLGVAS